MQEDRPSSLGPWIVVHGMFVGALWLFSVWAYPNLPEQYPVHFDLYGNPNRWVAGPSPEWFLVPAIATFLNLVFVGISWTLPNTPVEIINVPNKKKFLLLPRERQQALLRQIGTMLLAVALGPNIMLSAVQVMIYAVAQGWIKMLNAMPLLAIPAVILLVLVGWTIRISGNIKRESEQWGKPGND